ncbi:ABC transporter ATP-binding protein [bacterium]|nr:ABC transporter ATP-binding protein [bacterium]
MKSLKAQHLSEQHSTPASNGQFLPGTVAFEHVSKSFRRATLKRKSYSSIKSEFLSFFRTRELDHHDLVTALEPLTISVNPGSSLGVIGRNGSGKSTLLKLIAGIYKPDIGTVSRCGRISALIELGAGFHPEFTGRENIYLGGVMYGLTKTQIDSRFEKIVAYAELADVIDDPVKTYSSGMYMRLGFSLAIHTDPDILLVDEVLAVGDASFIHRCHESISEFRRQGKTLIFVTHDLASVERWCDEAIWLDQGKVKLRGEPRRVIDAYLQGLEKDEERSLAEQNAAESSDLRSENSDEVVAEEIVHRWGNQDVVIDAVRMIKSSGETSWIFHAEDELAIEVDYTVKKPITELVFGVGIIRADGLSVYGTNTQIEGMKVETSSFSQAANLPLQGRFKFRIKRLGLLEDSYYLDLACHSEDGLPYDYHHLMHKFSVRNPTPFHGVYSPEHNWDFASKRV